MEISVMLTSHWVTIGKPFEYHEKDLKIAIEVCNMTGEGQAYGSIGIAYWSLGDYRKAIGYHEKHLKIAMEIGDRAGEGKAYGNLGTAYGSLGDYRKAIEYREKYLEIAIEIGDLAGKGRAYGSLGNAYGLLGNHRKAIEYHKKNLKIAIEIGDRAGEGKAYHNIGNEYFSLEQFDNAVDNFASAMEGFNALRASLKSKDDWKINFREKYEKTYTALWRSLLRIERSMRLCLRLKKGRAQTLSDTLLIQYKLSAPLSPTTTDTKGDNISPLYRAFYTNYFSNN